MELDWIATDPDSLRLPYVERRSSMHAYVSRIEALRTLGEGYSEVHLADRDYPRIAFSFRDYYGVIRLSLADKMYLLHVGGVIADDKSVLVPGLDGDAEYSGAFVLTAERTWDLVKMFLQSGSVKELGEWYEL